MHHLLRSASRLSPGRAADAGLASNPGSDVQENDGATQKRKITLSSVDFKPVTASQPCRICGKKRWCRRSAAGGHECHQSDANVGSIIDGLKCITTTPAGFRIFRDASERTNGQHDYTPQPATTRSVAKRPVRGWDDPDEAARSLAASAGGTVERVYAWSATWRRVRIRTATGKTFRELTQVDGQWTARGPEAPHPLYRVDELPAAGTIYVCEGEKACDAAWEIGLPATTSGSSSSAAKGDWARLAKRSVAILADNDQAGRKYAIAVAEILRALGCDVRLIALPELPEGGDIVEFIEARDSRTPDEIRAEIEGLVRLEEPEPADEPAVPWTPFPVHVLPDVVGNFIAEAAHAIGVDPAYIAVPALCVLASAVGTTRAIELKSSWREYPILWGCLVARSGSKKTPAQKEATRPLRYAEIDAGRDFRRHLEEYEKLKGEYEAAHAEWKKSKFIGDAPLKPEIPVRRRYMVSDITVEALAPLLETNPRGLLAARDELAGWLRSFGQYKGGRGGDAAAWLELWQAGPLLIDRKLGRQAISVPRAACSVCGTIQPGTLESLLTKEHFESGLAARLLIVRPPEVPQVWTDETISDATSNAYRDTVTRLTSLAHLDGQRGPEPKILQLDSGALAAWIDWYNRHNQRVAREEDRGAAALKKIEAYAARFALLFELIEHPSPIVVTQDAIERGTALADWFADEVLRVYGMLGENDGTRATRQLVEWIERQGGAVTAREVQRYVHAFRKAGTAEAALDGLVNAKLGIWEHRRQDGMRGRPSKSFRLGKVLDTNTPGPDKNPTGAIKNEFCRVSRIENKSEPRGGE